MIREMKLDSMILQKIKVIASNLKNIKDKIWKNVELKATKPMEASGGI